jgi:hypothetical protein
VSQQSRRFTDREVAIVLQKASELDEAVDSDAAGGLSISDLEEIAREVGISASAIQRAVAQLDRGRRPGPSLSGAPLVRKAAHALPTKLGRDAVADLVRLIDEHADGAGAVTEALGSVRWTNSDRFRSTRVSITPRPSETSIEVVEKTTPRMRRIFHALPAAWAVMLAGPVLGALEPSLAGGLGLAAMAALVGGGLGRAAWSLWSASSARRVRSLAETLANASLEAAREPGPGRGSTQGQAPSTTPAVD